LREKEDLIEQIEKDHKAMSRRYEGEKADLTCAYEKGNELRL
jgi:hypothetical protein